MSGKVLVHGVNILPKEHGGLWSDTDGMSMLLGYQGGLFIGPQGNQGYQGWQGNQDDYGYLQLSIAGPQSLGGVYPPNSNSGFYLDETGGWSKPPGGGGGDTGPQGPEGKKGTDGIPKELDEPSGLMLTGVKLKIKLDWTRDQGLAITADGLSVAWEPDGGIYSLPGEGLRLRIPALSALFLDNDGVRVKLDDPGSGLLINDNGLRVNYGHGLKIDDFYETLVVDGAALAGTNITWNGTQFNATGGGGGTPGTTKPIIVSQAGSLGANLTTFIRDDTVPGLKLVGNPGLQDIEDYPSLEFTNGDNGLQVKCGNSISVEMDGLEIKCDPAGGLSAGGAGLKINAEAGGGIYITPMNEVRVVWVADP